MWSVAYLQTRSLFYLYEVDVYLDTGKTCGGFERPQTRNFVAFEEVFLPHHRQNDVTPCPYVARLGKAVHGGERERLRLPWIFVCGGKIAKKLLVRGENATPVECAGRKRAWSTAAL